MHEYQISVARDGQFLFRTDWDDNRRRVRAAAIAIQAVPDVKVTSVVAASFVMTSLQKFCALITWRA